ncbi:MAG: class I SAM-dependent methyltransferase [Acidimicrobiia bacterium]
MSEKHHNGGMAEASPWSRIQAELYALFGRNPRSNRLVVELAEPAPDHVTLDVGCGPGAAVRAAAPLVRRAVGVDNSAAMVRIAARRSGDMTNVEYQVGSAEALPFAAATFDRVWTVHAFHHWSEQSAGIAEALRVLRPDGRFLVVEHHSRRSHGLTTPEAEALTERLIGAGFSDARVERHRKELVITAHA